MKKTFLVTIGDEITTENELDEINSGKLFSLIYRGTGFRECEISVKEISEEQNCGTPDYSREKAFDLLKDACEHLSNSTEKYGISLSYRIEEYIKENTKGKTK